MSQDVEFRPLPMSPNYLVSSDGRLFKEIKGSITRGYLMVQLRRARRCARALHRLVAITFVPNPDGLAEVNHKDGNKLNNHASNLEWMTKSDNVKHAHATGLTDKKGSKSYWATIDEKKAVAIWEYCKKVKDARPRVKHHEIASMFDCTPRIVEQIRAGRTWRHVCK